MEDEDRKENLGQIAPVDSQALSAKSASFMRRGLRSLSAWDAATIIELGKALTSSLEITQTYRTIMDKVDEALRPDDGWLMLVDEGEKELHIELPFGQSRKEIKEAIRIKIGEGIEGWVAQHDQAVVVPDVVRDAGLSSKNMIAKTKIDIGWIVAVPMRHRNHCIGVVELVYSVDREGFSQADIPLLEAVADFAAIAIKNVQEINRVHHFTVTDDFTGLYNARHMDFILDTEIYRSMRYGYSFSLVSIAIESRKDLAKTLSYSDFRQLLREIAAVVKGVCRGIDWAFLYKETEFVLVLPQAAKNSACVLARHLHQSIRETTWLVGDGLNLRLTASIGVASYPDDAGTKLDLLHKVDEALYLVKNSSRDGVAAINVGMLDPL